jgi:PPM family protein phosphatase
VADGVGGGPSGDLASAALVHRLIAGRMALPDAEGLAVRIREANWDLRAHAERDASLRGMATTFTGIFAARGGGLLLAHTGDSRAYLLRDGALTRQTRDDSFVQALLDSGLIAPGEEMTHPRRHLITASLGGAENDVALVVERDARPGDRWLLCSDGITDVLPDDELARQLRGTTADAAAGSLVRHAIRAGTHDNVTAVVCDVVRASGSIIEEKAAFYGAAAARFCEELESA